MVTKAPAAGPHRAAGALVTTVVPTTGSTKKHLSVKRMLTEARLVISCRRGWRTGPQSEAFAA
jgi:hypothetical protein